MTRVWVVTLPRTRPSRHQLKAAAAFDLTVQVARDGDVVGFDLGRDGRALGHEERAPALDRAFDFAFDPQVPFRLNVPSKIE